MDTKLDSQAMIEDVESFEDSISSEVAGDRLISQEILEDVVAEEETNALPHLFSHRIHGLIEIRRRKHCVATDSTWYEQVAARHQAEQPVSELQIMSIQQSPHLRLVESRLLYKNPHHHSQECTKISILSHRHVLEESCSNRLDCGVSRTIHILLLKRDFSEPYQLYCGICDLWGYWIRRSSSTNPEAAGDAELPEFASGGS